MNKILLFIIFSCSLGAYSQSITPSVIATAGTSTKTDSVHLTYTIGEVIVPTFTNGNTLTQGFNQPAKITIDAIDNIEPTRFTLNAFPNPTTDVLNIAIKKSNINDIFDFQIFDINGKYINLPIETANENTVINTSSLPAGQYIVRVINKNSQKTSSVKITKLN